jgi:two-component system, OmpR family, sensor histidine kinase MprB
MKLRVRFALTVAVVAAIATLFATTLSYRSTSQRLDRAVDESLRTTGDRLALSMSRHGADLRRPPGPGDPPSDPRQGGRGEGRLLRSFGRGDPGDELIATQWLDTAGTVVQQPNIALPVNQTDVRIAAAATRLESVRVVEIEARLGGEPVSPNGRTPVQGSAYRIRTIGVPGEGAVQVARDVTENRSVMRDLLRRFVLLVGATSLVAALVAWLLAGQATKRLQHLEQVVTSMANTANLTLPQALDTTGRDETARVAIAFDRLVRALSSSREQQQRLVEDASHELRTPLTSLRTNLAVLPKMDRLPLADRERLVADVQSEVEELVHLVDELVEHATASTTEEPPEPVGLKELAEKCAVSVRRRTGRAITVTGDDSCVHAGPVALARVVTNLLGNAAKFDTSAEPVSVDIAGGSMTVRDHGPGFLEEDLGRVFDRFYRADAARSLPGSGLGLSIVADAAKRYGGSVVAANAIGGGALVTVTFPESNQRRSP